MKQSYQLTIDDLQLYKDIEEQPGRIAYIDECGHFGFNFDRDQTSKYFILSAIVVENSKLKKLHDGFNNIKNKNGFEKTELKSNKLSDDRKKRIMMQVLELEFTVVIFIVDKQQLEKDSVLTKFNTVFVKNMSQRLYELLYKAYPKLKIMQDKTGYPEFQEEFKRYVIENRSEYNLFNEYDFDFVDSKDEVLVQLADLISGSVNKNLLYPDGFNYIELLKGKIVVLDSFPRRNAPYWGKAKLEEYKYNSTIYSLAVKCAEDYINKNVKDQSDEKKAQISLLRFLLINAEYFDATKYIYSDEIIGHLQTEMGHRIKKDFLFRKVIAPLRDQGVILASSVHGYKIPVSIDDIYTYLNSTTSTVGPMMERMGICRKLIQQATDKELDVFNDEAFIRFKRYFDD